MRSATRTTHLPHQGRVFYDAECGLCKAGVARHAQFFNRHGVRFQPLQTPGIAAHLGITEAELRREMKLQLADGCVLGGVDAWSALFRSVWWLWPAFLRTCGEGIVRWSPMRWLFPSATRASTW